MREFIESNQKNPLTVSSLFFKFLDIPEIAHDYLGGIFNKIDTLARDAAQSDMSYELSEGEEETVKEYLK